MTTLTEFLRARIAEDERRVEFVRGFIPDEGDQGEYINPARVLAECEAKRRIVDLHVGSANDPFYTGHGRLVDTCDVCVNFHADMDCSNEPWPCPTLRLLALPYADHPEFRSEWRP